MTSEKGKSVFFPNVCHLAIQQHCSKPLCPGVVEQHKTRIPWILFLLVACFYIYVCVCMYIHIHMCVFTLLIFNFCLLSFCLCSVCCLILIFIFNFCLWEKEREKGRKECKAGEYEFEWMGKWKKNMRGGREGERIQSTLIILKIVI